MKNILHMHFEDNCYMKTFLLVLAFWLLVGVLTPIIALYNDHRRGEDITIEDLKYGILLTLFGPVWSVVYLFSYLEEVWVYIKDTVVIRGRKQK